MHTLMNVFGIPLFTYDESKTEAAFWALMAAPMIIDTDPRNMTAQYRSIALNQDLLAVNWDPLLQPGWRVWQNNVTGTELWRKPLANGDQAIIMYNANDNINQTITATWAAVGWPSTASVAVYDIWQHATIGNFVGSISATVPVHGNAFYRLSRNADAEQ